MSKITLGGVVLPKLTTMPELDFEPIVLYSKESITGRLHNVYQVEKALSEYGDYNSIRFSRKFKFEIISLTYDEWQALDAIDGTNCHLIFERDTYTEEYIGNLDCTFFKFDEHNYFDAVNIEFTVTSQVPLGAVTLMWIGFDITEPIEPNDSLMWISETYVPTTPTITKIDNTIVME